MHKLSSTLLAGVLVLAMVTLSLNEQHGALAQDAQATAGIGGDKFAIAPGDVVTQGTLTSEGDSEACVFPEFTLGASGDATISDITVSTKVTSDCQLIVADVDKTASGSSEAVMATTRYRGGAWAEHKDCCGFVLTRAYTDMYYYDGGSSVWGVIISWVSARRPRKMAGMWIGAPTIGGPADHHPCRPGRSASLRSGREVTLTDLMAHSTDGRAATGTPTATIGAPSYQARS